MNRSAMAGPSLTKRREFLVVVGMIATVVLAGASACKKDVRCGNCGMRIDRASAWYAELVSPQGEVRSFDTPRCALQSWRRGKTAARSLRVQDYYDRQWRDGSDVRFVIGGDVSGPMGPDLVPVDPGRVSKFIQDHGADRALRLEEVTAEVLGSVGLK